jgi:hypothetical protein
MMRIPDKIRISGFDYTIKEEQNLAAKRDVWGEADVMGQNINLDKDSTQQRKGAALIHEIIEVINADCELELEHYKIKTLGTQLYQVLRDNKLSFGD